MTALRLLLLMIFFLAPHAVLAATETDLNPMQGKTTISRGVANAYYQNCMSHDDKRMSESAQESLCSCAAAKAMERMTVEEIFSMKREKGPGRIEYNKMLTEVYAPCMQAPIEETLFNECSNDAHVKEFMLRDIPTLCRCTAMKSGSLIATSGPEIMENLLRKDPGIVDPLENILQDMGFRKRAYDNLYNCLLK